MKGWAAQPRHGPPACFPFQGCLSLHWFRGTLPSVRVVRDRTKECMKLPLPGRKRLPIHEEHVSCDYLSTEGTVVLLFAFQVEV